MTNMIINKIVNTTITKTSECLGQAPSWDMPFKVLGAGPLLGQALQNAWERPALGTCPSKCLGQARPWDMPFQMLGTSPLSFDGPMDSLIDG